MAVQKSKKSRSKRDMGRSHQSASPIYTSVERVSGEKHLRHHLTPNGIYKGKQIIPLKPIKNEDPEPTSE